MPNATAAAAVLRLDEMCSVLCFFAIDSHHLNMWFIFILVFQFHSLPKMKKRKQKKTHTQNLSVVQVKIYSAFGFSCNNKQEVREKNPSMLMRLGFITSYDNAYPARVEWQKLAHYGLSGYDADVIVSFYFFPFSSLSGVCVDVTLKAFVIMPCEWLSQFVMIILRVFFSLSLFICSSF